jgi:hypothetical protein
MLLGATSGAGSVAVAMEDAVPRAALLVELAEASCRGVLRSDAGAGARRAAAARAVGEALGEEALLDAAAVAAMFNGINRVADACGVRLDQMTREVAGEMLGQLGMAAPDEWRLDGPPHTSSHPRARL